MRRKVSADICHLCHKLLFSSLATIAKIGHKHMHLHAHTSYKFILYFKNNLASVIYLNTYVFKCVCVCADELLQIFAEVQ